MTFSLGPIVAIHIKIRFRPARHTFALAVS